MYKSGDLILYPWSGGKPGHIGLIVGDGFHPSVARGYMFLGKGKYKLGTGGFKPNRDSPFDSNGFCDCSGFTSYCLQQPRVENGIWWNTSSIYKDAKGAGSKYEFVDYARNIDCKNMRVLHCSSGILRPAVKERDGVLWKKKDGIVVRSLRG